MISAIACSGSSAAMSSTKSADPFSITLSTIMLARACNACSRRPIMRGVKPLFTSSRYRVCFGGSMSSMSEPRVSKGLSGSSPTGNWPDMIIVPPTSDEKVAVSRFTSMRSACFTTFQ